MKGSRIANGSRAARSTARNVSGPFSGNAERLAAPTHPARRAQRPRAPLARLETAGSWRRRQPVGLGKDSQDRAGCTGGRVVPHDVEHERPRDRTANEEGSGDAAQAEFPAAG
jgi:hypothetical protein